MGFAGGTMTFKRFFVGGESIRQVGEELVEQLSARSMSKDCVRTADKTEVGWTTGEHVLDTKFTFEKNVVADGLHMAMRVDTNRPPADIVRSYQKMNEQAMLEASGRDFLSKAERREAREQAKSRAEAEAKAGNFRKMTTIPVFWDVTRGIAYLGSAGSKAVDHFIMLFRETFDRTVDPAGSGEMAARWSALSGDARAFDDAEPAHFVNPPDGAETASETAEFADNRAKDFLGTEFLSWLWYTSHVESPDITVRLGESVTVLFDKTLQLECAFKVSGKAALTADAPTRLPEAVVALAGGKRPIRAGLQIAVQGDVFAFSLRGDAMNWSGLQVPPPEDVSTPRAVFEDRIEKLRTISEAVSDLYTAFLKRRLSAKWSQTLSAMRSWIASGRHASSEPAAVVAAS